MADLRQLALAALLHDIGKFWQRTGMERPYPPGLEDDFCPARHGQPTHQHAVWGGHFVEQELADGQVAGLVYRHHRPTEPDLREVLIISLADWLASAERIEEADGDDASAAATPLRSVFSQIFAHEGPPLRSLPLSQHTDLCDAAFFPAENLGLGSHSYRSHWEEFCQDVACLRPEQRRCLDTWYHILRKWTARVPSATPRAGCIPDISLFDHLRVTAAIATCLFVSGLDVRDLESIRTRIQHASDTASEPIASLVCGDLSGIQRFLYTLTSEHAVRSLKGRSFFLKLLADTVSEYLWQELGLNRCCLLLNSGGHFFLLAPRDVKQRLEEFSDRVNDFLARRFGGDLMVAIGVTGLSPADFVTPGRFAEKWGQAADAASRWKRRKFNRAVSRDFKQVFGLLDEGGSDIECPVCHGAAIGPEEETCALCAELTELGEDLRRACFLIEWHEQPVAAPAYASLFAPLGRWYAATQSLPQTGPAPAAVWQINAFDIGRLAQWSPEPAGSAPALGYFMHGTHAPVASDGRAIASFEQLAARSIGDCKLGFLRADVDDLGRIIRHGLGEQATASRMASLSGLLVDFFEGRVTQLLRTRFADTTYLVYSGGDDLFLVGAWHDVIEAARQVQQEFTRLTGGHPCLTISAGVVITDHKFPLLQAARLAGDAEDRSKSHRRADGNAKSAFTVFDTTVGWEELPPYARIKQRIVDLLSDDDTTASRALLRKLYDIWAIYQRERELLARQQKTGQDLANLARWSRWRWMLVYSLRDLAQKGGDRGAELLNWLLDGQVEQRLGLALRWAEMTTRKR